MLNYELGIIAAWESLTPEYQNHGLSWYQDAHRTALDIAADADMDLDRVCGVIARLSPGVSWENNIDTARAVCVDGVTDGYQGYSANMRVAFDVMLNGWTETKTGPKISAFYDNILYPEHSQEVTLDRHMLRFLGEPKLAVKPKRYHELVEPFRAAAVTCAVLPHQLQAAIWTAQRDATLLQDSPA